jgi:hypothetical protein
LLPFQDVLCRINFIRYPASAFCSNYLEDLGRRSEEWQVRQAADAIRLYRYFLSSRNKSDKFQADPFADAWKQAADSMIRMLRLKQRAYQTEQTYRNWLRTFYAHVRPVDPKDLTDDPIVQFLSYLAAERHIAKATQDQAFHDL